MHSDCVCGEPSGQCASASLAPGGAGIRRRLFAAGAALVCCGILAVAAWLKPNSEGHGTHRQLGMRQCSHMVLHGLPCPSCGLTTSVSAAAHGEFVLAARAQPFGIVLALALAAGAAAGALEALTGRRVLTRLRPRLWWLFACLGGLFAGWLIVLAAGLANGSLPAH